MIIYVINKPSDDNDDNADDDKRKTEDLTIKNSCDYEGGIWIEGRTTAGPVSGITKTPFYLAKGESINISAPKQGEVSDRFWAKWGCDTDGQNCLMGDQAQRYPGGGCPSNGCTAPLDTLFEPTWGCSLEKEKCAVNPSSVTKERLGPTTFFDLSLVDGYSLPMKIYFTDPEQVSRCHVKDPTTGKDINPPSSFSMELTLDDCPLNRQYKPKGGDGKAVACMSPCKYLVLPIEQGGLGLPDDNIDVKYNCCTKTVDSPTCVKYYNGDDMGEPTLDSTRQADAVSYKKTIASKAPLAYSFPYDDLRGSINCDVGVKLTVEFCGK